MKTTLFLYPVLLALLAVAGCGDGGDIRKIDIGRSAVIHQPSQPGEAVSIGIASIVSPQAGYVYYEELLAYLQKKIARPVSIKQGTYRTVNDLLRLGEIQLAFVCSGPYVEAHEKFGAGILAVPVINGRTTYRSYIIVPADSPVTAFRQLKGKRFAFIDSLSCTGYLYPMSLLAGAGSGPNTFSKTVFTRSHDNSIIAVAEKLVDGAAVSSVVYDSLARTDPALIAKTKIIDTSPAFTVPPIVIPRGLDPALRASLEHAFLTLHEDPQGKELLKKLNIDRFIPADDRVYDDVRAMKRAIRSIEY